MLKQDFVAYLLEVDAATVSRAMVTRTVETQRGGRRGEWAVFDNGRCDLRRCCLPGSVYDVPLNPAQAASGRDALAKAIYNNLFEWIVSRVNVSMKPRQATAQVIGVLDIYGFEIFQGKGNSFQYPLASIRPPLQTTASSSFALITSTRSSSRSLSN